MKLEIIGQIEEEYLNAVRRAFDGVIEYMEQADDVYVELTFASSEEIRQVNLDARGVDAVTDVLSFPALDTERKKVEKKDYPTDVEPESGAIYLGDIMLCVERAKEQAKEYGHSEVREFAFLVTHGMLHLFGFDHVEKEDEEEMFPIQDEILERIGITR